MESVVFYKSYYDAISNIPEEEQLKLYKAIFDYSFLDIEPNLGNGIANAMFILMKPNIDSANIRYKNSVNNGKKGGRPKKNNLEETQQKPRENPEETQKEPKQNLNYNYDYNYNLDLDADNRVSEITKSYEENIGMLAPAAATLLFSYLDDFEDYNLIIKAIEKSALANKRSTNYINGILKSWKSKGYKVLADLQNEDTVKKNENQKSRALVPDPRTEEEYFKEVFG